MENEQSGSATAPTSHPGQRLAWCLLALGAVLSAVIFAVFLTDRFPAWRVPAAYLVLLGAVASLPLSAALALRGPARAPLAPLVAGSAFVAGGAAFDVGATLWHTPDLAREGNPVVRALLGSGRSVGFVLAAGAVGQIAVTATLVFAWAGLLRHRPRILSDIPTDGAVVSTVKAATGGANLTWRQWFFPMRYDELPNAYHLWWSSVSVLVAGSAYRWYLGMEWVGLVPFAQVTGRKVVIVVACSAGLVAYLTWLSFAARSRRTSEPAELIAEPDRRDV